MATQQKSAWYQLIVGLTAVLSYLVLRLRVHPDVAPAAFAVIALVALVPVLFPREVRDERERLIADCALVAGGSASYLFVVGICMLIWWTRYRNEPPTVDVALLPLLAVGACAVLLIVRSAAVLVLHSRSLDQGRL
ncbi:MAG: hypothetical protein RBT60_05855 [Candidatus Krumholzibacteria bacterium]|nr:hypothetical protein [Candidatus Krumholzibacteria bacterium]